MEITPQEVQSYIEDHTSEESPILKEINRETHLKVIRPRMLSGHFQGRLLALFSQLMRPQYILEIGTYTGYASICLVEGMQADGKLITIDYNDELVAMIQNHFDAAGFSDKIEFINGDALEILPKLDYTFDMVFIDADKIFYSNYYDLIIDKVRPGGLIIIDNVLWSGKVMDNQKHQDKTTETLRTFNQKVHSDSRVENIMLPVRDGLLVARKLK